MTVLLALLIAVAVLAAAVGVLALRDARRRSWPAPQSGGPVRPPVRPAPDDRLFHVPAPREPDPWGPGA